MFGGLWAERSAGRLAMDYFFYALEGLYHLKPRVPEFQGESTRFNNLRAHIHDNNSPGDPQNLVAYDDFAKEFLFRASQVIGWYPGYKQNRNNGGQSVLPYRVAVDGTVEGWFNGVVDRNGKPWSEVSCFLACLVEILTLPPLEGLLARGRERWPFPYAFPNSWSAFWNDL